MAEKERNFIQHVEIKDYDLILWLWENRIQDERATEHMVVEITIEGQRYQTTWPIVPDEFPTIENRLPPLPRDSCQD